jgi:hypothetical protein
VNGLGVKPECLEPLQPGLERAIVDARRRQLHLDPFLEAQRTHALDVPGPGPVAEAAESVDYRSVVGRCRMHGRHAAGCND